MASPIEEIKERIDIVGFIRSYIPLLSAGKNFKSNCPFHKEKTPSFMVSPERQTWHCFGSCAEGGDIFKFLMKYENLEFYEALKVLAERAGVELKRASPAEYKQFGVLFDINSLAKDFFKKELERNPDVLAYTRERGLTKETIDEFELGFAPAGIDRLTMDLINIGFSVKDIERAGLAYKSDRGGYLDRFRGRLMFPIYNSFGKVVGFSGRILQDASRPESIEGQGNPSASSGLAAAKYINSPESPIFNKSRIFYGLHKTKNHIKEEGKALLVEGQMDFLMVYQDGVKNVVATSGTALTSEHLKSIKRLTDQLVLAFDNDEAGIKAAERSIDLAGASDFNVKLLLLRDYKDPAEAALKQPGIMAKLLERAVPAMEFYFERYSGENLIVPNQKSKADIGEIKRSLRLILRKIKNLVSPVEQSHWIKELSDRTGISEKALTEEMEQVRNEKLVARDRKDEFKIQNPSLSLRTRRDLVAERLLSLALVRDDLKIAIEDYLQYLPEDYLLVLDYISKKTILSQQAFNQEKLKEAVGLISLRSSFELEVLGEDGLEKEFAELIKQIQHEYFKEKQNRLLLLIKEFEGRGDEQKMQELLKEFNEISHKVDG